MNNGNNELIVFLAEDNPGDVFLIKEAFVEAGINVDFIVKTDGEVAASYVSEMEKNYNPIPDLIILDINLPYKNGFEIFSAIKNSEKLMNVPVVIFTSSKNEQDRKDADHLGAAGYFSKPLDYTDYVQTVRSFLTVLK